MPDIFKEIIPAILQTKKNPFQVEHDYKVYAPFIVNRAISYHLDCVLYANEMNMRPFIDKDQQFTFLLNTIRSMKRKFQPWQKSSDDKDMECVKVYFGYSNEKAKEALRILTIEQLEEIKNKVEKGGVKK
jgi:hypothetical protein